MALDDPDRPAFDPQRVAAQLRGNGEAIHPGGVADDGILGGLRGTNRRLGG
jgi:hypothetical protein